MTDTGECNLVPIEATMHHDGQHVRLTMNRLRFDGGRETLSILLEPIAARRLGAGLLELAARATRATGQHGVRLQANRTPAGHEPDTAVSDSGALQDNKLDQNETPTGQQPDRRMEPDTGHPTT